MYNKIKSAVIARGLSMMKFYELIGIEPSTFMRRVEHNKVTVADVKKIKEVLQLSREEMLSIFFEGVVA